MRIKASFIALLQTESFEKLSVSAIAKTAGINRGTFYLHYVDKYALLEHYEDRLTTQVEQLFRDEFDETMHYQDVQTDAVATYPVVRDVVDFVASEFDLFKVLFGPTGDPRLESKLKTIVRTAIAERLEALKGELTMTPAIPSDYAWELVISGLFSIIKTWLESSAPMRPEEVCAIIMKTRFLSPYDLLGLRE
ncbi:TetR/AcrR family transcriptional regulator C-terminal domain-containing protein [Lacticaseibacillus sp. GG6-2]